MNNFQEAVNLDYLNRLNKLKIYFITMFQEFLEDCNVFDKERKLFSNDQLLTVNIYKELLNFANHYISLELNSINNPDRSCKLEINKELKN